MLTTVAPEIVAFDIGEGPANWGDTVTATCTVVKGDHPIQIEWALNGEPISRNHYDISIVNTSKRVSLLTIDGVTARHAGEYTCSVSNAAGGTSYSATLAVNGTPNPPRSRSLLFFRACTQPSSFPPSFLPSCILPRRRGEKGISNENEFVSLSRSRGMRRIKIGFNKIVLKQISVVVVVAPHIGPFSISDGPANSGDMVSATCSIMKGDFPVEIVWKFNGRAIGFNDPDLTITRINKHMSALSIESVAARHAGEYTCVATNRAGNVTHSTTLAVNGIYTERNKHACTSNEFCTSPN